MTEQLPRTVGGRAVRRNFNYKPGRAQGPVAPPVSGYIAHYDFSDVSTLTLSNGNVSAVADKVGSFNLAGGGASIAPIIPYETKAGRVALAFNADERLTSSCPMDDISSSLFFVACVRNNGGGYHFLGCSASGGAEIYQGSATGGQLKVDKGGTSNLATLNAQTIAQNVPFAAGVVLDGAVVTMYLNGTSETDDPADYTFTAGRTLQLGASRNSNTLRGWMGEVVIYNTTLNATDAALVISYLMSKWELG